MAPLIDIPADFSLAVFSVGIPDHRVADASRGDLIAVNATGEMSGAPGWLPLIRRRAGRGADGRAVIAALEQIASRQRTLVQVVEVR